MESSASRLERLPAELLHKILTYLKPHTIADPARHLRDLLPTSPTNDNAYLEAQRDLLSTLVTSKGLRAATLPVLYRRLSLSTLKSVHSLNAQLTRSPDLGNLVRVLDLESLRVGKASWNEGEPREAYYARVQETSEIVTRWLGVMPRLQELRTPVGWTGEGCEDLKLGLDLHVLKRVARGQLPNLRTLEWGPVITPEFEHFLERGGDGVQTRVEKMVVRSTDVEMTSVTKKLLAIMPRVRHLDLTSANVFIVDALAGLAERARLVSLTTSIKPSFAWLELSRLMASNPETFEELVMLDLKGNWEVPRLESEEDITKLISSLPASLRSLNLEGFSTCPYHLHLLEKHCPQLEELSIENGIQMEDLESMLLPPHVVVGEERRDLAEVETTHQPEQNIELKHEPILGPMARAVAVCKLRRRLNSVSIDKSSRKRTSKIRHLRVRGLPYHEQRKLRTSILLGEHSQSLGSIQVSEEELADGMLDKLCHAVGWKTYRRGRSCWIEREQAA
ncbi:hypothetical protein BJ875DRAFT_9235 [Amylocarpus encephaloides]|uniref:F-box domain-containing protein n=1 Tax=Amylocarpus encephaloides TaxID=45428 RepID=A0A9P7YJ92_9HELO|nr:hypothetical protein BJ875DRAFT_9235 [Amylocarpus encephaloides]